MNGAGGGIEVPPGPDFTLGATLELDRVTITRNRVEPTRTMPVGPPCPNGPCPYAEGDGGRVANLGNTTITRSIINGNTVAGVASDARGGGISSYLGNLALDSVTVIDNQVVATRPNGRFAEGGGVFVDSGSLQIGESTVADKHRKPYELAAVLCRRRPDQHERELGWHPRRRRDPHHRA